MIWEAVIDSLYPRRCPLCGKIVRQKGWLACPECHKKQKRIHEPKCWKCGKQLESEETLYCSDCFGRDFSYERCYALWKYDAQMRRSIWQFKYGGRQEYADYYIKQLLAVYGKALEKLELDAVIPVPVHPKRLRHRGYNQAELLAAGVASALEVPMLTAFLVRSRDTTPQRELDPKARRKNLQTAFSINERSPHWQYLWKKVLLVDDIYTTGSTVEGCAATLRQAGTDEIYVLALCIGQGM